LPDARSEIRTFDAPVMSVLADHLAAMKGDKRNNERHGEGKRLRRIQAPKFIGAQCRRPVARGAGRRSGPSLEPRPYGNRK
jgi:hypothetical protein